MNHNIKEKERQPVREKLQQRLLVNSNTGLHEEIGMSPQQVAMLKRLDRRTPIVGRCR